MDRQGQARERGGGRAPGSLDGQPSQLTNDANERGSEPKVAPIGHPATIHPLGKRNAARATPLGYHVAQAMSPKQRTLVPVDAMAAMRQPGVLSRTGGPQNPGRARGSAVGRPGGPDRQFGTGCRRA